MLAALRGHHAMPGVPAVSDAIYKIVELAGDLVLVAPPIDRVEVSGIPPEGPKVVFFSSLALMIFAVCATSTKQMIGDSGPIALIVAAAVAALVFVGLEQDRSRGVEWWLDTVMQSWVALVLSVRFAEGATLGTLLRKRLALTRLLRGGATLRSPNDARRDGSVLLSSTG